MEEYGPAPHLQYRSMGKREMPPLPLTICARGRAGPEVGHKSRIRWHRCERANPKGIKNRTTGSVSCSLLHRVKKSGQCWSVPSGGEDKEKLAG